MRKRITALLALLCLFLGSALPCFAEDSAPEGGKHRTVIDDGAFLLEQSEYPDIIAEMEKAAEYCAVGLYTYGGTSQANIHSKAEDWANEVFEDEPECVVFIIDMATRQIAVSASEGIRKTVTTARGNLICDNVYRLAKSGEYGECAKEAFRQIFTTLNGGKVTSSMMVVGNILMAVTAAILLAYLVISARMEQEVKVSLPEVVTATAGVGAVIAAKKLTRVVHHESSSGGRGFGGGGGHGGGGGFGGGGGHSMGGGSHGF